MRVFVIFICFLFLFMSSVGATTVKNDIVSLASGSEHTLFLMADGNVYAWGGNNQGQLGVGSTSEMTGPVKVMGLHDVIHIYSGMYFSIAVTKNGDLYTWGIDQDGSLGQRVKSGSIVSIPTKVLSNVKEAGTRGDIVYALTNDGYLHVWGDVRFRPDLLVNQYFPYPVRLDEIANVAHIKNGYLVLKDGSVGELGQTYKTSDEPAKFIFKPLNIDNVENIITNFSQTLTLVAKTNGSLWKTGEGRESNVFSSVDSMKEVLDINASGYLIVVLDSNGDVWTWGTENYFGEIGNGDFHPRLQGIAPIIEQPVKIISDVKLISKGGGARTTVVKEDGSVWQWGLWDRQPHPSPIKMFGREDFLNPISVRVNQVQLTFEKEPFIKNGYTMAPLRTIFEHLGASVKWNGVTRGVTADKGDLHLELTIGSNIAYLNGVKVILDQSAEIDSGVTLVPVRFIAESLGAKVDFDAEYRIVNITTK